MQMQGSKPECVRGRTQVRSRRMSGAGDEADAQNGKKAKARIEPQAKQGGCAPEKKH